MKYFFMILVISIVMLLSGCNKSGGVSVGVNSSGHTSKDDKKKDDKKPPVVDNKLVTTTVTTSQKVEELVPPPPVKKITVTTGTTTTATLNGVPVKPEVQVHETPKVVDPAQFAPVK